MTKSKPNPIEAAVSPLREDAKLRAREEAKNFICEAFEKLTEHGWDINKAAPYPMGIGHGYAYYVARSEYDDYHAITASDPAKGYQSLGRETPFIVVMDSKKMATFIDKREEQAAREYDAFVAKLTKKIGPVIWAELVGNHVWGDSILTVKPLGSASEQRWATKQITNRSKYHRLFYQWPTRKMK